MGYSSFTGDYRVVSYIIFSLACTVQKQAGPKINFYIIFRSVDSTEFLFPAPSRVIFLIYSQVTETFIISVFKSLSEYSASFV
jgi:hypothetical protein